MSVLLKLLLIYITAGSKIKLMVKIVFTQFFLSIKVRGCGETEQREQQKIHYNKQLSRGHKQAMALPVRQPSITEEPHRRTTYSPTHHDYCATTPPLIATPIQSHGLLCNHQCRRDE
jgi:hypothetical protein